MKTGEFEGRSDDWIDVWYARTDGPLTDERAKQLERLLSKQEISTSQRFLSKRHSDAYQLAHGMVRLALSHYVDAAPEDLQFRTGRYGKPALAGGHKVHLDFSLSHTTGVAVCAVATAGIVGVDVERKHHDKPILDVAKHRFAASEVVQLDQFGPATAADRALELWTLKESFVKALGAGLHLPLNSFAIHVAPMGPPTLGSDNELREPPEMWRFACLQLESTFKIAVAQRFNPAEPRICVRQICPPNPAFKTTPLAPNPSHRWAL